MAEMCCFLIGACCYALLPIFLPPIAVVIERGLWLGPAH
jgi:uncharacterized membrane protein YqaE (UPF0057 family)